MTNAFQSRSALAVALLASLAGAQTTWYVDVNGTPPGTGTQIDPYVSIQQALDEATTVDGDTVLVAPGTYAGNLTYLGKAVAVRSQAGPEQTSIAPTASGAVVVIDGPDFGGPDLAVLEGFTVLPPLNAFGIGVTLDSGVLDHCIVQGSTDGTPFSNTDGVSVLFDGRLTSTLIAGHGTGLEICPFQGLAFVTNSIVRGNSNDAINETNMVVDYSALSCFGDTCGQGLVLGDPELWDIAHGDYRIRPGSPLIDAGDPSSPPDPDGSPADIGPLPFDPSYSPGLLVYCTAKTNSLGCVPFLAIDGVPSATSTSPFRIRAVDTILGESGFITYSFKKANLSFHGGKLCVKAPFERLLPPKVAKLFGDPPCRGALTRNFNNTIQNGGDPQLSAGATVFAQWRQRDPGDPTGFGDSLTEGVRFTIQP